MTTSSPRCVRALGVILALATLLTGAVAALRTAAPAFSAPAPASAATRLGDLVDALPDARPGTERLTIDRLATDWSPTDRAGVLDLPAAVLGGAVLLLLPAFRRVLPADGRRRLAARPVDVPRGRGPPTRG